ncbi:MAG: tannase/feruloyl esterase family alpha/beta hydrolase [Pseudomonadota bacterium]|nr:tannase/feruloyl esterase family alpha/beta hydrolase [Pseudomonadota bacterium]
MQLKNTWFRSATYAVVAAASILQVSCGGGDSAAAAPTALACDDGIKSAFMPDANTKVLLVKAYKQGDSVALSGTPATPAPPTAPADMCLVKLLVGPGNAGPAGAPSTSAGIGIEVWLPTAANWNQRIRAYGSGGWAGSSQASTTQIGGGGDGNDLHVAAAGKGYVVVTSDHGHAAVPGQPGSLSASFAMAPDGTINTVLWEDFAERSLHEMADKSKALAKLYYGTAQKYAYWDGFSTGGRQGLKLAQVFPNDFDGILAGAPAINWTRFITNELYPQVAMQRDLGAAMSGAKLNTATTAAIAACGGGALGFLLDPYACHYDPTRDATVLCSGVAGNGGTVGTSTDSTGCMNLAEATDVDKIWYGQTADGSVPDPALDNAAGPNLVGTKQLWFGLARGAFLGLLAGDSAGPFGGLGGPFPIAADQVALELQDPTIGSSLFTNALSNGMNNWKSLSYAGLTVAAYQGLVLQPQFGNINTDRADLTAFNQRNGKLIMYHGLADNLIAPQGSDNYYGRVSAATGGLGATQSFARFFHIPGLPHSGRLVAGPNVPVPQSVLGRDEMFLALQNWVEAGTPPGRIDVSSSDSSVSMPICVYPQKITYSGTGSASVAGSYACQ